MSANQDREAFLSQSVTHNNLVGGYGSGAKVVMSLVTKPIFGNRSESRCLRRFLTFLSQFLNLLIRDLSEIGFIS